MMTQVKVTKKMPMDDLEVKAINTKKQSKCLAAAVLLVLALALIVSGTVTGIIIGRKMAEDIYEESWVTYRNTDTDMIIKQRYIVDGNEVVTVKPGEISVVHDYEKRHVVMQVDEMKFNATNDCLCFVHDFEDSEQLGLAEIVNFLRTKENEESGQFQMTQRKLDVTNQPFDITDLSKRSRELCHGCVILKATMSKIKNIKYGAATRPKRGSKTECTNMCVEYCYLSSSLDEEFCGEVLISPNGLGGTGEEILD